MCKTVNLARARGMCAGVDRAIKIVNLALDKYGTDKVYVLHEVVHNKHVVESLRNRGAHFVDSFEEIPSPKDKILIFSAHGVGIETFNKAKELEFKIIDATCPVVSGIHRKMNKAGINGLDAVVIGHKGHQEVVGTVGQYIGDRNKVHVVLTPEDVAQLSIDPDNSFFATQTTLSIDETAITIQALKQKYPSIVGPKDNDTCRATQVRQNAVKQIAAVSDVVIIAGSKNSSNSNRLKEVSESQGTKAYLVDDSSQIDPMWFKDANSVGLSAGASAPEYVIEEILSYLNTLGFSTVVECGDELKEKTFPLKEDLI
ncbi:MAG: 4-hydroxy-3-methylbut-2-enyl diphosphate reductase [Succinivibrio sp.]|uniref:4-hydroxy-3-methylbut-2-enyl diphosphate reductase n=1 Tax=Succinivibrio sp. TaxID=2053619 RepID=UPI002F91E9F0